MFFKKKNKAKRHGDKIWISKERKYAALIDIARDAGRLGVHVVFLTHFRKSFNDLAEKLADAGVYYRKVQSSVDRLAGRGVFRQPTPGGVAVFMVNALPEEGWSPEDGSDSDVTLRLVVVERYPVPKPDERIERFADSLRVPVELEYHGALDEPLFQVFGGGRIVDIFKHMGVDEAECIQHTLISKAVRRAQERLAQRLTMDSTADSVEDWVARNAPEALGNG
jgi:preprotein translocase subunit SecA